jgi:hypothetical protein
MHPQELHLSSLPLSCASFTSLLLGCKSEPGCCEHSDCCTPSIKGGQESSSVADQIAEGLSAVNLESARAGLTQLTTFTRLKVGPMLRAPGCDEAATDPDIWSDTLL